MIEKRFIEINSEIYLTDDLMSIVKRTDEVKDGKPYIVIFSHPCVLNLNITQETYDNTKTSLIGMGLL